MSLHPGVLRAHVTQKYLLNIYYVSGPVLQSTKAGVNEIDTVLPPTELMSSVGVLNPDFTLIPPAEPL